MNGTSRKPRTVGLDKPCSKCGKPIHYSYVGPVEGVCGRCVDKRVRKRRVRPYHMGMTVGGRAPKRRSNASTVVVLILVMVVGSVLVAVALGKLLG